MDDIEEASFVVLQMGIFDEMYSLRTLRIGLYHTVEGFNIPALLQNSDGLKNLEIYVGVVILVEM